jgi:hypothetical protein
MLKGAFARFLTRRFASKLVNNLDFNAVSAELPLVRRVFLGLQEIESAGFAVKGWGELELTIKTGEVDYRGIYEFPRATNLIYVIER